jgi:hypothetical protein
LLSYAVEVFKYEGIESHSFMGMQYSHEKEERHVFEGVIDKGPKMYLID